MVASACGDRSELPDSRFHPSLPEEYAWSERLRSLIKPTEEFSITIIETTVYIYRKCQSEDLVKNGPNAFGSLQYHCKACGAYGVLERKERAMEEKKELVIKVYQERSSMRGIERTFGVSRRSACGDRSENTSRILWDRVPSACKEAIVFSDYWRAYQAVIPTAQHRPGGKETGETAHIERWNNPLRQHLARFVRRRCLFPNGLKCMRLV